MSFIKTSWVLTLFDVLVKLLDHNSKTADRKSAEIDGRIDDLRIEQAFIIAEGQHARRVAVKLRSITE